MASNTEIEQLIVDYLASATGLAPDEIVRDSDFIADELLDSFGVMSLILELESSLGIKFDPVALTAPEARTVTGLASLAAAQSD